MRPSECLLKICEDFWVAGIEEQNFPRIFWWLAVKFFVHLKPSLLRLDVGQAEGVESLLVFGRDVVMLSFEMPKEEKCVEFNRGEEKINGW